MNIELCCATPDAELYANVRQNARACSRWLSQADAHDGHAVLVGGGPSLADKLSLLRKRHALGQTIFALNGACRFLNENGITPDYQVFLDANKAMGERIGDAAQYLVSSQCAPELLNALPPDRVTLWHFALPEIDQHLPEGAEPLTLIGGGVSVGLSAMPLAYAMGYRKLHLFGYDSSNRAGRDHAYDVPITEEIFGGHVLNSVRVEYGDQVFDSTLSMAQQAECFPIVCNALIDLGCIITVEAEGLIKAVMDEIRAASAVNQLPERKIA